MSHLQNKSSIPFGPANNVDVIKPLYKSRRFKNRMNFIGKKEIATPFMNISPPSFGNSQFQFTLKKRKKNTNTQYIPPESPIENTPVENEIPDTIPTTLPDEEGPNTSEQDVETVSSSIQTTPVSNT